MKNRFTPYSIEDVQKFLLTKGIVWNGENMRASDYVILADVELKRNDDFLDAEIFANLNETTFDCWVTINNGSKSESNCYDFSYDWLKFRLQEYPNNAHTIYSIVESEIKEINDNSEKEINELQKQINEIKAKAKEQTNHLQKFKKVAKAIIDSGLTKPEEEHREL